MLKSSPAKRHLQVDLELVEEVGDAAELPEAHLPALGAAEGDDAGLGVVRAAAPLAERHGVVLGIVEGWPGLRGGEEVIKVEKGQYFKK